MLCLVFAAMNSTTRVSDVMAGSSTASAPTSCDSETNPTMRESWRSATLLVRNHRGRPPGGLMSSNSCRSADPVDITVWSCVSYRSASAGRNSSPAVRPNTSARVRLPARCTNVVLTATYRPSASLTQNIVVVRSSNRSSTTSERASRSSPGRLGASGRSAFTGPSCPRPPLSARFARPGSCPLRRARASWTCVHTAATVRRIAKTRSSAVAILAG